MTATATAGQAPELLAVAAQPPRRCQRDCYHQQQVGAGEMTLARSDVTKENVESLIDFGFVENR